MLSEAIQRSATDAVYLIDRSGALLSANDRLRADLGLVTASGATISLALYVSEEDRGVATRVWETVTKHRRPERSIRKMRAPGGTQRVYSVVESPVLGGNDAIAIIGVARDVTEEAAIEEKLWSQQENREAALEYAVRASMGLVKGYVYSLKKLDGLSEDKRVRFSNVIAEEVDSMGRSIDNLLFSRSTIELNSDSELFDMREIVREAIAIHKSESERREIALHFVEPHDEINFHGHEHAIGRVVSNLLDFCLLRLTHSGSITVTLQDCEEYIEISVEDEGSPVTAEQATSFFMLERNEFTSESAVLGSKYDLDVARLLCESMGGGLSAQAREEQGVQFSVMLPRSINYLFRDNIGSNYLAK